MEVDQTWQKSASLGMDIFHRQVKSAACTISGKPQDLQHLGCAVLVVCSTLAVYETFAAHENAVYRNLKDAEFAEAVFCTPFNMLSFH